MYRDETKNLTSFFKSFAFDAANTLDLEVGQAVITTEMTSSASGNTIKTSTPNASYLVVSIAKSKSKGAFGLSGNNDIALANAFNTQIIQSDSSGNLTVYRHQVLTGNTGDSMLNYLAGTSSYFLILRIS